MANIWKTEHNYGGYRTNMLKKKGLQLMFPSGNDKWSRDLDRNNKNGKAIVPEHPTTWNETCSTSSIKPKNEQLGEGPN